MKRARKLLAFVLAMVMLWVLTACGGQGANGTNRDNDTKGEQEKESFDAQKVMSQLEVKEYRTTAEEYTYASIADGERQLVYCVKNNSDFHVKLTFKITTYNADKEVVQILHENIGQIESGREAILKCTKLEEYVSCTYEIDVEEVNIKEDIASNVSYEMVKTKEKIFLTLTNNGERNARGVAACLLCYKGREMVYCHGFNIFLATAGNFSSGESVTVEWTSFEGYSDQYDHYEVVIF